MWTMAGLVWSRLRGRAAFLLLGVGVAALGSVAFDPDLPFVADPVQSFARGHLVLVVLCTLVVVFFGSMQVASEVQDKTIAIWLTRPLSRPRYVAGKVLGTACAGWALLAVLGIVFGAMLMARGHVPPLAYGAWLVSDAMWLLVLASITTCFSTAFGSMASAMFASVLTVAGLVSFALPLFAAYLGPTPASWVLWALYLGIPNWQHFSPDAAAETSALLWIWRVLYAAGLAGFYLVLGVGVMEERDLS